RHTRFSRDWSSDVCSSDLSMGDVAVLDREMFTIGEAARLLRMPPSTLRWWLEGGTRRGKLYPPVIRREPTGSTTVTWGEFVEARSEERRVGREGGERRRQG